LLKISFFLVDRNAQQRNGIENQQSSSYVHNPISTSEHYQKGLSAFCTPVSPQQSNSHNTFAWPFSTSQNQKVFIDLFLSSTLFIS
jgi:hypothetical protein